MARVKKSVKPSEPKKMGRNGYKTEELKAKAIKFIEERKLVFFADVFPLLGIASSTFYSHFPSESSDYKDIEQLIEKNRVDIKTSLRNKWFKSDNATLQIMLMKLVSTSEERKLMSQSFVDVESQGKPIGQGVDLSKLSTEALLELKGALEDSETEDE